MAFRNMFALAAASALSMAAFATAADAATTAASVTVAASALPSLVNSMPECAGPCFQKVGAEIGCDTTDLKCMCSQDETFKAHFGTCAQKDCFAYLFDRSMNIRDNICAAMSKSPDSTAIASASGIIASNTPKETSGAVRLTQAGLVGAAAWGALML